MRATQKLPSGARLTPSGYPGKLCTRISVVPAWHEEEVGVSVFGAKGGQGGGCLKGKG